MVRFELNGESVAIDAPKTTPLLWILRDTLNLTGTKYGCGKGLCGACTVHLNDAPVRSCQITLSSIKGQRIVTIEGLTADKKHPVPNAWIAAQVPQCGYCQSGQIMSAAALLTKNPQPSDEEIVTAMEGNLCRCGTYLRIRRAIRLAADAK